MEGEFHICTIATSKLHNHILKLAIHHHLLHQITSIQSCFVHCEVNVQIMDTIREHDGLAMSSRNAYLTTGERERAPIVYKALCAAREVFDSRLARGVEEVDATDLQEVVKSVLNTEPLITEVQYVALDDLENMQPVTKVGSEGCIISLACMLGSVRLIDNIVLR